MTNYIALGISILSFLISCSLFISGLLSKRYKLGISINESYPNVIDEILFLRVSFINESSSPITIQNLMILDHRGKQFLSRDSLKKTSYFDRYFSPGELYPRKIKVIGHSRTGNHLDLNESTAYLPMVVAPYSSTSAFFAFKFSNDDSEIVNGYSDVLLEVETSKGFFTIPKRIVGETRKNRVRLIQIYWKLSFTRRFIPLIQRKFLMLSRKATAKLSSIAKKMKNLK